MTPYNNNPYGGQPANPYGGQPANPYGGQPANPYGGQPANPYGGQPANPYGGQPANPYGGQPANPYGGGMPASPIIPVKTDYSLVKYILLGVITFGIYDIVMMCVFSENINKFAEKYDGNHTMHCLLMALLAGPTFFIYPLIWYHKFSERVGRELARRNIGFQFSSGDFWLWNVLGTLFVVGPLIYMYKLIHAMNLIGADYNLRG